MYHYWQARQAHTRPPAPPLAHVPSPRFPFRSPPLHQGDAISSTRHTADGRAVHRVHCSLNINTETGRLSARRPNLQNQPALEKDRYKVGGGLGGVRGGPMVAVGWKTGRGCSQV